MLISFFKKIIWRFGIFFRKDFYGGGLFSLIFLLPLRLRNRYPKSLSLTGYLSKKIKSLSIKESQSGWKISSDSFVLEIPSISDDIMDVIYPFLGEKNKFIEKFLSNPFYSEGFYMNERCFFSAGDSVIDMGANVGFFTIPASKLVGLAGKVYSFEPVTEASDILKNNMLINSCSNIQLVNSALGSINSEVSLNVDASNLFESSSVVIEPSNNNFKRTVNQLTLDEFITQEKIDKVDFIKVDIEGAERDMLKGAEITIKRFKPRIAIRIYHLPDDPSVIEDILRSYVPQYKIEKFYNKTLYAYL